MEKKLQTAQTDRTEQGQSLVEMAISLVFLLILLSGIIDLGRIFFTYIALRDAAQEGASYAAICPVEPLAIDIRVRNSSHFPVDLTDHDHVEVHSSVVLPGAPGTEVNVEVLYNDFQLITPFLGTILGTQTINLNAKAYDIILQHTCP